MPRRDADADADSRRHRDSRANSDTDTEPAANIDSEPKPPTPTPAPTPAALSIASVRALADGPIVTIEGVLTTPLGAVESGRGGFVQDATAGIGLYLDATVVGTWPAGTRVRLTGSISSRFAQRVIRVAERDIEEIGVGRPSGIGVGDDR